VPFTVFAFVSHIQQIIARDGAFAVIFLLIVGLIAGVFVAYLVWDLVSARIERIKRRRQRRLRRAEGREKAALQHAKTQAPESD
jgi:peptidoglycan/LPS O-acetylase OafA/YrhL